MKRLFLINGEENQSETDAKDNFKSTNFGVSFDGGVNFPLGKYTGQASIHYGIGLTNISEVTGQSVKTRSVRVLLGLGL